MKTYKQVTIYNLHQKGKNNLGIGIGKTKSAKKLNSYKDPAPHPDCNLLTYQLVSRW